MRNEQVVIKASEGAEKHATLEKEQAKGDTHKKICDGSGKHAVLKKEQAEGDTNEGAEKHAALEKDQAKSDTCLLYTSPSPRD